MKAILEGVELAHSDAIQSVEGNHYFPPRSVNWDYLSKSATEYTCPWKGDCTFYDVNVEGEIIHDGAWSYDSPKPAALDIAEHVAFGAPVEVR